MLKKDFTFTLLLAFVWVPAVIVDSPNTHINFIFIIRLVFLILFSTLITLPVVILCDYLIIGTFKTIFNDYKIADKSGRILIIISIIAVLLRKIIIWTK